MAGVDDVKSVTDLLSKVTDGFKDFFNNLEGTLERLAGIPNLLNGSDDSLKKVTSSAKDATVALDKTHNSAINLIDDFVKFGTDVGITFSAMSKGSHDAVDALGNVNSGVSTVISSIGLMTIGTNDAFKAMDDGSKFSTSNLDNLSKNFNNILDTVQKFTGFNFPLSNQIQAFVPIATNAVDTTNNLETSLLGLHASVGDLTTAMGVINGPISDASYSQNGLNKLTDEYVNVIKRTVDATGASIASVVGYTKEIIKIPGLYNEIVSGGENVNKNLSFTEAAMKVTKGTTQDFGATLDIARQQMLNFKSSGESSLELLSRMYSVSNSLGTPFNFISDQVKQVSEQFKFLGNNTQGALNIFQSLGTGLKDSGIGPKAISEIVQDVTSSIGQLDIAQKSFLSAQSGGAGGLQGGYQIDQLLAEGKIDQIYNKIEGSLRQEFGGKVTTLKEGSQDAGSAQQLTKEVAFLTQGPFGQIVKSSAEAYKLLDAFKTGNTTAKALTEDQLKSGLDKTLNAGSDIQKAQYTELQKIANNTALFQLNSQRNLGENVRSITATNLQTAANPISYAQSVKESSSANKSILYAGSDLAAGLKGTYNNVVNSGIFNAPEERRINIPTPTTVENRVARNNENITPQVQSPELNAQRNRENLLRERQERPDTVTAGLNGNQTIIIKTQQVGLDGKTKEELAATITAHTIKKIQIQDQQSALIGHQGNQ